MKIDKTFDTYDPGTFVDDVRALEEAGYDGLVLGEAANDPTVALAVASQHTSTVDLVAGVLIALPRSPTHVAYAANDLQSYSGGRYVLGLGSQIKAHIEKRFSATWDKPVGQMREFVLAVRAIFDAWERDEHVDFRGDHYQVTLMPPYFRPRPSGHGCPPIWLAGVGRRMVETAAEVADGLFVHPFTSESYLRGPISEWLAAGAQRAGRDEPTGLALPVLVAVGEDEASLEHATAAVRRQIAFYGSTPAYKVVLDHHGFGDLQPELNALSKQGRWDDMTSLIDDDVLDTFAVRGDAGSVAREITRRFGGLLARCSIYTPNYTAPREVLSELMDTIQSSSTAA